MSGALDGSNDWSAVSFRLRRMVAFETGRLSPRIRTVAATLYKLLAISVTWMFPVSRSGKTVTKGELRDSNVDGKYVAPSTPSDRLVGSPSALTFVGGLPLMMYSPDAKPHNLYSP